MSIKLLKEAIESQSWEIAREAYTALTGDVLENIVDPVGEPQMQDVVAEEPKPKKKRGRPSKKKIEVVTLDDDKTLDDVIEEVIGDETEIVDLSTTTKEHRREIIEELDTSGEPQKIFCKKMPFNTEKRKSKFVDNIKPGIKTKIMVNGVMKVVDENAYLANIPQKSTHDVKKTVKKYKLTCNQCKDTKIIDEFEYQIFKKAKESTWKCDECITAKRKRDVFRESY